MLEVVWVDAEQERETTITLLMNIVPQCLWKMWGSSDNQASTGEIKGKIEIESRPDQEHTLRNREEPQLTGNDPNLGLN